jgi:hypothetical protein
MKTTIHILREKNGVEHHGLVEVRRDADGDLYCRVEETMLERIDCGDCLRDTSFILEADGELYEGGREVTLTEEECDEAERELTRLEEAVSASVLSPITELRGDAPRREQA